MTDERPVLERYQQQLGAFIHDFTWMEVSIFDLLCAVAGVIDPIGKALFNGARADAMISSIRRCYIALDEEVPAITESALAQASILNRARNEVVHRASVPLGDDTAVLTMTGQRVTEDKAVAVAVTPEALAAMAKDARLIMAVMVQAAGHRRHPQHFAEFAQTEPLPWHYKPSPPSPDRHKGHSRAPE